GILTLDDSPADLLRVLGRGHSERINTMVTSVITASENSPVITMTDEVGDATARLREFLFDRVYRNPVAKGEESKAKELLSRLFDYFCQNPERMPELYVRSLEEEGVGRCVCDYLAGLTDRYAIELYRALYIPRVWGGK
ncbi:MAG: deoxyguanosinetriphosphate triphosphohydrolase, partial [Clostridia bacterium]|nr:deoxyguanosinetriphosphate triphosphohydrolase [Clostridia bacterium]